MNAAPNRPRRREPTPIDSGAVEHLRYIRSTIEAAHTFTTGIDLCKPFDAWKVAIVGSPGRGT